MVFERVKDIIVKQLEVDPELISLETSFTEDLGADSLDVMEIIMAFENEFDVEVDESVLENIRQVKDIVEYIEFH